MGRFAGGRSRTAEGEQVQQPKPQPGDPVSDNQLLFFVIKIFANLVSIMENRLLLKPVVVQQTHVCVRQALLGL